MTLKGLGKVKNPKDPLLSFSKVAPGRNDMTPGQGIVRGLFPYVRYF